jgi:hypothetical protein
MRTPNLFVAGAPKCGTSSLCAYLQQHPDIYFPAAIKEPTFFGSDFYNPKHVVPSREQYLALFAAAGDQRIVGEGSTSYFFSTQAAAEIKAFAPSARIIIMLRNPVDLLHALHGQLLYGGAETIEGFEEALNAEERRRTGTDRVESLLQYRRIGQLATHLERYIDAFGRSHVHVIIFDDFARDTNTAFRKALEFLDVAADFSPQFRVVNPNKKIRSRLLHRLMVDPPAPVRTAVRAVLPRPALQAVFGQVRRLNTSYKSRAPLDPTLRRQLQAEFAREVERLSVLVGRDLRHWSTS